MYRTEHPDAQRLHDQVGEVVSSHPDLATPGESVIPGTYPMEVQDVQVKNDNGDQADIHLETLEDFSLAKVEVTIPRLDLKFRFSSQIREGALFGFHPLDKTKVTLKGQELSVPAEHAMAVNEAIIRMAAKLIDTSN